QDEDVLDTWFSSALWPFSTLGWPEDSADLARYYPTDVLVTGYDIIFFWVARMAFQARHFTENRPFKEVLIHGLIRDMQGRKMSKSLGNGIDPMDVIENKGADALRFFLTTNSAPGMDLRFDETKLDSSWNFINKIWNASRFVQMQLADGNIPAIDFDSLSEADQWILARLNETIKNVDANMDKYELAMVGNELYSFVWNDFCSWYIELSKAALNGDDPKAAENTKAVLAYVLKQILILLSPFMPFVTEHIYQAMGYDKESINLEVWPEILDLNVTEEQVAAMNTLIDAITAVREIKLQYNMKPKDILVTAIVDVDGKPYPFTNNAATLLKGMAHIDLVEDINEEDQLIRNIANGVLKASMANLVNLEEEAAKLEKEEQKLISEIARAEKMLSNPGFVNKAPAAKVEAEKEKLEGYSARLERVKAQIEELKAKMK
ncbi:MAG: class I tRNA ligase family protein, partial [Ileibacterium sp.]|nr:class I tRNA ligase family protein [Ileibacterium sp.]